VRTLLDGVRFAGEHTMPWDGRDDSGRALPNGVFVVRLETGLELLTTRVALAR
jgi:flagellar hook assembly protein FlgD